MIRSYYRCCCINEPVMFSNSVHLKLGHRFHALLKVCSDCDDIVPLNYSGMLNNGCSDSECLALQAPILTAYLRPAISTAPSCSQSKNSCALSVGSPSPYVAKQKITMEFSISVNRERSSYKEKKIIVILNTFSTSTVLFRTTTWCYRKLHLII